MRYFILVAAVALGITAPAAGAKPAKVAASYSVVVSSVSGANVKFVLVASIDGNSVPGCKGKVTASHKLSKKSTKKWSGSLKQSPVACSAKISGKLPKAKYGKDVKFTFTFPGNTSIKKFSKTKSLKLVTPTSVLPLPLPGGPPAPGPPAQVGPQAFGFWTGFRLPENESKFIFKIKSPGHTVSGFSNWLGGNNTMNCGVGFEATQVPFNWNTPFTLSGPVGQVVSEDNGPNFSHMVYTFDFSFTNANEGSGSFSALGGFDVGGGDFRTCSLSYNFRLQWTGPEF